MDPVPGPAGEAGFGRHPDTLPRSDLTHSVPQASSSVGCGSEAESLLSAPSPVSTSRQGCADTGGFSRAWEACAAHSFVSPGDSHPTNKHPTKARFREMLRVWNWSHVGLWVDPLGGGWGRKLAPGEGRADLGEDFKAVALGQRRGLEAAPLDNTWVHEV